MVRQGKPAEQILSVLREGGHGRSLARPRWQNAGRLGG
jgi:hypothetical protein